MPNQQNEKEILGVPVQSSTAPSRDQVPQAQHSAGKRDPDRLIHIVWNGGENEGVVFVGKEGLVDARQCARGDFYNPHSAIGEAFAEAYDEDERKLESFDLGLTRAAPCLLKALKELASNAEIAKAHLHPDAYIVSSALFDAIDQARAAIARAEPSQ